MILNHRKDLFTGWNEMHSWCTVTLHCWACCASVKCKTLLLGDWSILFCWLGQTTCKESIFWYRGEFCLQVVTNMLLLSLDWIATWWKYATLCSVVFVGRLFTNINWWRVCHSFFYFWLLVIFLTAAMYFWGTYLWHFFRNHSKWNMY